MHIHFLPNRVHNDVHTRIGYALLYKLKLEEEEDNE